MPLRPDNPLIVQSDRTLMLHTVRTVTDADGYPLKDDDGNPLPTERLDIARLTGQLDLVVAVRRRPRQEHGPVDRHALHRVRRPHQRAEHGGRRQRSGPPCDPAPPIHLRSLVSTRTRVTQHTDQ